MVTQLKRALIVTRILFINTMGDVWRIYILIVGSISLEEQS